MIPISFKLNIGNEPASKKKIPEGEESLYREYKKQFPNRKGIYKKDNDWRQTKHYIEWKFNLEKEQEEDMEEAVKEVKENGVPITDEKKWIEENINKESLFLMDLDKKPERKGINLFSQKPEKKKEKVGSQATVNLLMQSIKKAEIGSESETKVLTEAKPKVQPPSEKEIEAMIEDFDETDIFSQTLDSLIMKIIKAKTPYKQITIKEQMESLIRNKIYDFLEWLYNLMGEKMEFVKEIEPEEMKTIELINVLIQLKDADVKKIARVFTNYE